MDSPQKYLCTCDVGWELYTEANQNGFGATVAYGDDTNEDPDEARVLDHSCIRKL